MNKTSGLTWAECLALPIGTKFTYHLSKPVIYYYFKRSPAASIDLIQEYSISDGKFSLLKGEIPSSDLLFMMLQDTFELYEEDPLLKTCDHVWHAHSPLGPVGTAPLFAICSKCNLRAEDLIDDSKFEDPEVMVQSKVMLQKEKKLAAELMERKELLDALIEIEKVTWYQGVSWAKEQGVLEMYHEVLRRMK